MIDLFDISETVGLPASYDPLELTPSIEPASTMEAGVPNRDTITLYEIDGHVFTYAQYQAYLAQQEQIYNDMLAEYEAAVEEATKNALAEAEAFIGSIEAPVSRDINDYLTVANVTGSSPSDVLQESPTNISFGQGRFSLDEIPYEQDHASTPTRYYDSAPVLTEKAGIESAISNAQSINFDSSTSAPKEQGGIDSLKNYGFFSGGITSNLGSGFSFAEADPGQDDFRDRWSNWPRRAKAQSGIVSGNLYEPEEI